MTIERVNHVRHGNVLRVWVGAVALACLSLTVHAGTVKSAQFAAFMDLATGATKHTITMGSNGTPLVTAGVPGASSVGNMNIGHAAGGKPFASGTATLGSPIGKSVAIAAKQPLKNYAVALGTVMGKTFLPLSVGLAIYDLIIEKGYTPSNDVDGNLKLDLVTEGTACVGPSCYWVHANGNWNTQRYTSASVGCDAHTKLIYGATAYGVLQTPINSINIPCRSLSAAGAYLAQASMTRVGSESTVYSSTPVTHEQFIADIADDAGFPAGSAIDRALADAINAGGQVDTDGAPTLTPSANKVTGTPTVKTNSDGSSQTSTSTCDLFDAGGGLVEWRCGVTTVTTTVPTTTSQTVVTTAADGSTSTQVVTQTTPGGTTSSTTSISPEDAQAECLKSPDTLGCSKLTDAPVVDVPRSTFNITFTPDDLGFGNGACPAPFTWSDSLGSHSLNLSAYCSALSTYVKPIILMFSLLAAIFIVMPRES